MLDRLHIENFALMDKIDISFSSGLNVLSGETGAGKSIIIDATDFVLGGRGSQEYIRTGSDKAFVEALFRVPSFLPFIKSLVEYGFQDADEKIQGEVGLHLAKSQEVEIIFSREISKNGKNHCRINGRSATLAMYKEIGQALIDIHGQHDHQTLMNAKYHLDILDNYGGKEILELRNLIGEVYQKYKGIQQEIKALVAEERDQVRLKDMLEYQLKEIQEANLTANEDEQLAQEKNILGNSEKLSQLTSNSYQLLFQGYERQKSIYDSLAEVINLFTELKTIDTNFIPLKTRLDEAYYVIEDIAYQVRDYKNKINFDPILLHELETRLDIINKLKKKYGSTIEEILDFAKNAQDELNKINNHDEVLKELEAKKEAVYQDYLTKANQLSKVRRKTADDLQQKIQKQLQELHMPKVKFEISLRAVLTESKSGLDEAEFLISPNPGEPLKSLAKIASGGELSRVMLAMKTILAKSMGIPTLIFDEVDTGIGGAALQGVAEKLALIGEEKQVICITHAPKIAGFANSHYFIEKTITQGRTKTSVKKLSLEERIQELARMLNGKDITETTIQHAKELLRIG